MKKVLNTLFAAFFVFVTLFSFNQTAYAAAKPKITNIKVTGSAVLKKQNISVSFTVNTKCTTSVRIYDKNNKLVVKLKSKTTQKNKTASFKWNGKNSKGKYAAAGKYKIKMFAGSTSVTKYAVWTKASTSPPAPGSIVNLVFIHHSVGGGWLSDGLGKGLNDNKYHAADITYGWQPMGNRTDTDDWPAWFTDDVMNLVYNEKDAMSFSNSIGAAEGENTIVMFKSCYPNSDVGSSVTDEKAIYNSLLPYFEKHPDKMFILVTPPPMINISNPGKTRELCNWLTDRQNGWLGTLKTGNVFTFDLYNVLTHPDAHHSYANGSEIHDIVSGANELYYYKGGDSHPTRDGNVKASNEFIALLNYWYQMFSGSRN